MKYTISPSARAKVLASKLSLREALDQVFCPLLNFVPTHGFGAAHLSGGSLEQISARIRELRAVCEIPPLR